MSRSVMAHVVSAYFGLQHKSTESEAEENIKKLQTKGERKSPAPRGLKARYQNNVFYLNETSSSDYIIFYIHGGAYLHDFSPFHWKFIRNMIEQTGATVIAPAYHLIPFGTCHDAFDLIVPLYRKSIDDYSGRKIILMGDSAGGGLALALAEYLNLAEIRMPDETILMSPWVDVSMENPDIALFTAKDPWLTVPGLSVCGRYWAGEYDVHDYRVSPIFGDVSSLANITAFVGTRELFYPDVVRLFEALNNIRNELIIGNEMNHVFPILPIPEAKEYRTKIIETIRR